MVAEDGIINGASKEPSQRLVAELLIDMCMNLPGQTARNAWMKKGFNWL